MLSEGLVVFSSPFPLAVRLDFPLPMPLASTSLKTPLERSCHSQYLCQRALWSQFDNSFSTYVVPWLVSRPPVPSIVNHDNREVH